MEEKKLHIGQGKVEVFLVCDKSLGENDAPFLDWLHKEGFRFSGYHGNYGCWWVHVNITRKEYAYGMPGVELAKPLGNHAITIEEFYTIYDIYKKYEGKGIFVFHEKPFDYDPNFTECGCQRNESKAKTSRRIEQPMLEVRQKLQDGTITEEEALQYLKTDWAMEENVWTRMLEEGWSAIKALNQLESFG